MRCVDWSINCGTASISERNREDEIRSRFADRLGALTTEPFRGDVFRATRTSADLIAPSLWHQGREISRPLDDASGFSGTAWCARMTTAR